MWHKMRKIVIMVNKGLISIQLDNKQDKITRIVELSFLFLRMDSILSCFMSV